MGSVSARIARNTAWFTVGSILQKMISFAYFTVIAMVFGVEGTGRYFFALAFTALFAVAVDWGVSPVITREVAKDRVRGVSYVLTSALMKCVLAVAVALCMAVIVRAIGYDASTQSMIALAVGVMLIDTVHLSAYAILRGIQRVKYEAIGLVVTQFTLAASGIGILVLRAGLHTQPDTIPLLAVTTAIKPIWLLVPYVAASSVNLLVAVFGCLRERVFDGARQTISRASLTFVVRTSTPFAISSCLARLYTYSDTFLLSILATGLAVGYYSTPFKIAFAFQFIPLAFMGALYPAMSAIAVLDVERLRVIFVQALRVLWVVALPLAFGIGVLAREIILMVYGEAFLPSAMPLILLMAAIPFIYANFPAGNLLNACDRQLVNTKLLAIATTVNVIANILLIPPLGAVGAALSALIASLTLFTANCVAVRRIVHYRIHALVDPFIRVLVAALCMSAIVIALHELTLFIRIGVGVVVYAVALLLVQAVRRSDLVQLRSFFRSEA
ncbi:MAG: flippase [Candidatus Uhrbacteria bacterium]